MSQAVTSAAAPSTSVLQLGEDAVHVVLFGLPGSGKTSLLAALGQLVHGRQDELGGTLTDTAGRLAELARRVQASVPAPTSEEIVAYPIRYEPAPGSRRRQPLDAVLLDCSGVAASQLIASKKGLEEGKGTLAREVAEADTLVLVVDASARPDELALHFTAFGDFLAALRVLRGERTEVAGLPVFLVLNRCDLLAQASDSMADWVEHIERRKQEIGNRFREFLARKEAAAEQETADPGTGLVRDVDHEDPLEEGIRGGFGRFELHFWATASKHPLLLSGGDSNEPYGVAGLFRQCLTEALNYRERCQSSHRRLVRMVMAGLGLVVGLMLIIVGMLLFNQPSPTRQLEMTAEDLRFSDRETPAERLTDSDKSLHLRKSQLREVREHPDFGTLSGPQQRFVKDRLAEVTEYLNYLQKLVDQRPSLYAISTEFSLDNFVERLRPGGDLALPDPEWAETPAGRLHRRRLDSAAALQRAVQQIRNWYVESSDLVSRLWSFAGYAGDERAIDWQAWTAEVERVLDRRYRPPFAELEPIPGMPDGGMTYGAAYRFDRAIDARTTFEVDRGRLRRLLELTTAVGLARASKERPAVLVSPPRPTLAQVRQRLTELKSAYPDYERTFVRETVPESLVPVVARAARAQYNGWLEPARAEVLRQLQLAGTGREETEARWGRVRNWLRSPDELTPWRVLTRVLLRLADPSAEDPVVALGSFLARSQLVVEKLTTVRVEIPRISGLNPREDARLTVNHSGSARQPALAFEPSRARPVEDRGRGVTIYTYLPVSASQRLVFKPGDKVTAELPLRGGKERLVWAGGRSDAYQIESLRRPPRVQSVDAASPTEGRTMAEVRLLFRPDESVPVIPELMPEVRLVD